MPQQRQPGSSLMPSYLSGLLTDLGSTPTPPEADLTANRGGEGRYTMNGPKGPVAIPYSNVSRAAFSGYRIDPREAGRYVKDRAADFQNAFDIANQPDSAATRQSMVNQFGKIGGNIANVANDAGAGLTDIGIPIAHPVKTALGAGLGIATLGVNNIDHTGTLAHLVGLPSVNDLAAQGELSLYRGFQQQGLHEIPLLGGRAIGGYALGEGGGELANAGRAVLDAVNPVTRWGNVESSIIDPAVLRTDKVVQAVGAPAAQDVQFRRDLQGHLPYTKYYANAMENPLRTHLELEHAARTLGDFLKARYEQAVANPTGMSPEVLQELREAFEAQHRIANGVEAAHANRLSQIGGAMETPAPALAVTKDDFLKQGATKLGGDRLARANIALQNSLKEIAPRPYGAKVEPSPQNVFGQRQLESLFMYSPKR